MTAGSLLRSIHHGLRLFLSLSIQGAASVSVGGLLAYVAVLAGVSPLYLPLVLLLGMAVPQWPLRVYFSPERELERKFAKWDGWVKKGYITRSQCKQLKEAFLRWYGGRIDLSRIDPELRDNPPILEHYQSD
jgi:hypothetical protein